MQIQQASEDTTKDKMIKNEIEKEWILLNNEITVRDKEGNFSLHKDKEAVKSYFLNWVNTRTRFFHKLEEKLDFLITKGYYVDFFQWYSLEDMKKVFKKAYDKKFRFQSYMAAFKFYESYAMKDESGELFLERYEDRIAVTALFLAKNRENRVEEALQYVETIINQEYQPATPTFLNAGKLKGGLLVSCFKADAPVRTLEGVKRIEDVKVGDKVLTHSKSYKPVVELMRRPYNGDLISLTLEGNSELLEATTEHPILGIKREDIICKRNKQAACLQTNKKVCFAAPRLNKTDCIERLTEGISSVTRWYPVSSYKEGDYVAVSFDTQVIENQEFDLLSYVQDPTKFFTEEGKLYKQITSKYKGRRHNIQEIGVRRYINITPELGRLIGYFIAEGHLEKGVKNKEIFHGISFTFNTSEEEYHKDVKHLLSTIFDVEESKIKTTKQKSNCITITLRSKIVAAFINHLVGTGFATKKLCRELMQAPSLVQENILIGAIRGDGWAVKQGYEISLANKKMIEDLRILAWRLGFAGRMSRRDCANSQTPTYSLSLAIFSEELEHFARKVGKNLEKIDFSKKERSSGFAHINRDGYVLYKVSSTHTSHFKGEVYNLEVEEDHTYTINNFIVHNCYLDEIGDSLPSIGYAIDSAMYLSAVGGGVSFNFSKLRARTEAIKGVSGRASGVLPVMKIMEDTFSYANQLGQRPGAGAAYLNIFHADIEEFLDCKKINVDEKSRIKSLSIGVIIPDKFMELAEKDEPCYVFYPYTVFKAYGVHLDDMDLDNETLYQELVENVSVKKKAVNARQLLIKLSQVQKESGYPYIFFKGNANANHALKQIGSIQFSNLCTEVLQVSQVSEIRPYGEEDDINYGISCILGSVNIAPVMENKNIKETVRTAMYTLTAVSDETNVSRVPTIAKANKDLRSVGLGAMNLHGFLAKNQIMYESEEAREFADKFFMLMNYYSLVYSNEIAKERKSPFVGFEKSEYANGNYFDNYLKGYNTDFKFDEIKSLFEGIELPSISDWRALEESVREHGLYHAYRLAIAPNQSTSYIMNATASTMPIVDQIEVREYGDSTTYYPMPYLNDDNIFFYKSAYDMNQFRVMDMIATIQKHIDQGISCILHTNSKDNTRDIARYYIYAHKVGLKTLYYTRTRKSTVEDCVSCSA